MEYIKNSPVIKFLTNHDLKTKLIKLALVLAFMFLGFVDVIFTYALFVLVAVYLIAEFSFDSILWVILTAIYMPYEVAGLIYAIMWEMTAILLIKLIVDIVLKKINYKNWQFITIMTLFATLSLLVLLPLCVKYSFGAQIYRFTLFALATFGIFYVKEINFKHIFILFAISVSIICFSAWILLKVGIVEMGYTATYSSGVVHRFAAFSQDPNFTGAILICAIMCWFIAYKKNMINKYLYFAVLTILGVFTIMTISKAVYFIVALFGLYVVVENIIISVRTRDAKHLIELAYYALVLGIACLLCWQYLNAMYQRIFNPGAGWWNEGKTETGLSNLTTGRIDLWKMYLKEIFGSWQIFLFGAGASAGYIGPGAAHSMPIDYLYRYGGLATLILVAIFVVAVIPYLKKSKVFNFVPFVLITGIFCSIGSISPKYIYIFVIIFLTLTCNSFDKKNNVSIDATTKLEKSENG